MEAADVAHGDRPADLAVYTLATLIVFWLAHVYADVLGDWAENGRTPTRGCIRRALQREWPMVAAPALPLLVLLSGIIDLVPDQVAVSGALGLAVVELGVTAFHAARRGGAKISEALVATCFVGGFGVLIVLLKNILH